MSSNAAEKSRVFALGDSHCLVFKKIGCVSHVEWMPGKTMHGFAQKQYDLIRRIGAVENDVVLYLFGEVDVRCHIEKIAAQQKTSVETVIESLVTKFIHVLAKQKTVYKIKPVVCSIVPPTDDAFNVDFPYYGTLETRIKIQKLINQQLKKQAHAHQLLYLDYADLYALDSGRLNPKLSDGNVHVSNHALLESKLNELLATLS